MPKCAICKEEIEGEYIECPISKEMFHFKCARMHVKNCNTFHRRKVVRVIILENEQGETRIIPADLPKPGEKKKAKAEKPAKHHKKKAVKKKPRKK